MRNPLQIEIHWRNTASPVFPFAAKVDGKWWVLRLNSFPDHPLFTLFIDGEVARDLDDPPNALWHIPWKDRSAILADEDRDHVLTAVRALGPYGSEVGEPCDGDLCRCSEKDEALVTKRSFPKEPGETRAD